MYNLANCCLSRNTVNLNGDTTSTWVLMFLCHMIWCDSCLIHIAGSLCIHDGTVLCLSRDMYIFWWIIETYWAYWDWLSYWATQLLLNIFKKFAAEYNVSFNSRKLYVYTSGHRIPQIFDRWLWILWRGDFLAAANRLNSDFPHYNVR